MDQIDDTDDDLILAKEGPSASLSPGRERALIRHLPYFVTLAEEGHFSRASGRLGISQSALTRRIQALEQELGLMLFARTKRAATLTAAGQVFHEHTERILKDLRSAVRRTQLVSRGEAGDVHVALNSEAICSPIIIRGFRALQTRHPQIKIHLHSMPSEAQLIALMRKDIDIGFLYDVVLDRSARRSVNLLKISDAPSMLAVNADHPLASRPKLKLADIGETPLTWPPRRAGRSVSDGMIAAFRAAGLSPNIALEVMTDETTMSLAAANLAMGFVRPTELTPENVVLRRVEDLKFSLALHGAWLRDNTHTGIPQVIDELRREIDLAPRKRVTAG